VDIVVRRQRPGDEALLRPARLGPIRKCIVPCVFEKLMQVSTTKFCLLSAISFKLSVELLQINEVIKGNIFARGNDYMTMCYAQIKLKCHGYKI
jgi:hypothetical protein